MQLLAAQTGESGDRLTCITEGQRWVSANRCRPLVAHWFMSTLPRFISTFNTPLQHAMTAYNLRPINQSISVADLLARLDMNAVILFSLFGSFPSVHNIPAVMIVWLCIILLLDAIAEGDSAYCDTYVTVSLSVCMYVVCHTRAPS